MEIKTRNKLIGEAANRGQKKIHFLFLDNYQKENGGKQCIVHKWLWHSLEIEKL